ncbi:MAG: ABC transporter ATP-binding protein/permease [Coriobacteriales bacterium]|jgi:ATP-binding cassette subfamily B protein|nr:ABC transporter ATP-binding protein/permease [Coriobacteriales bacterium]
MFSASANKAARKPSVIRRTLHYYWAVTAKQMPIFILAVASTLAFIIFLTFVTPFVVGLIVDRISAGEPVLPGEVFSTFGWHILIFVGANILGQVGSKLQDYSVWKLEIKANYELATYAFDTLSNQSMTFHSDRFAGSLVSQTQKFIAGYSILLEVLIYALFPIVLTAVFTIAILAGLLPLYVAVLSALLVVYVIVAWIMYRRVLPLSSKAAAAQSALSGELSDSITNILAVKSYGRESFERGIFDDVNRDVVRADSRRMRASTLRGAMTSFIIVVIMAVAALFIVGANSWFGISAGVLVMAFTYTYSLTMQFNRISMMFQHINRGFGEANDMTRILDEPLLVADRENAGDLTVSSGDITFEDVSFGYLEEKALLAHEATPALRVFSDFSLHIPGGQRIGLVGRSGSGKTTLTTLLLRLSNLQEGRILIDGQDIAELTQVSLRQQIAYVPQEPLLFHRSIRENIAYGCPSATETEIREAAVKANALEFIEQLPHGFETLTGERGVKLSGGQRQRIAIARAILANKPLLVLDEATSALDSESEKLIQDALHNLMHGRTSIVIAHRLSTVASLDRIIVLRDGAIVEDGTHASLVDGGGEYARLWNRQSGMFLGDE